VEHLQHRLEPLEQQMHTVQRQLRWWRGLAAGLLVLAVLTWALPGGTAQEETMVEGRENLAHLLPALGELRRLLRHLTVVTDEEGRPEVVITRANLRNVNGLGSTSTTNGLGNLIVGYNEPRPPEATPPDVRTGSHNVVVGYLHNFSRFGGLVVGVQNEISGAFASVSGGSLNTASGTVAAVSGGQSNTASGDSASVSGGNANTARGEFAAVSGGQSNMARGFISSVSGGDSNTASGNFSSISGGSNRTAEGDYDWVAGSLVEDE